MKLNANWRAARFGLQLVSWAALVVGYLFLVNAAVMFALAPHVFGRTFFRVIGLGMAVTLGMLYLSLLRRALKIDSDTIRQQVLFMGISVVTWLLTNTHPEVAEQILTAMSRGTPLVLAVAGVLLLVGLFYCLAAWGGARTWLTALFAFFFAGVSALFLLAALKPEWVGAAIPNSIRDSVLYQSRQMTAVGAGCLAVFVHALYLRLIALRFHDSGTAEFILRFLGPHIVASAVMLGSLWFLLDYQIKPVLQIGNISVDVTYVTISAIVSLVIAVDAIWLSRCVLGSRSLINLSRVGN